MKTAEQLTELLGQTVEDHPFDRGYWSRDAGLDCPSGPEPAVRGWRTRNWELMAWVTKQSQKGRGGKS